MGKIFNLFRRNEMASNVAGISRQAIIDDLDNLTARISAWAAVEHAEDGTHNINYINQPRCIALQNGLVSVPNATQTTLTFNSEVLNVGSVHSTTVNNSRFTASSSGLWFFQASITWAASGAGSRGIRVKKNGVDLDGNVNNAGVPQAAIVHIHQTPVMIVPLITGDYIEVIGVQTSGGALNTSFTTNDLMNRATFIKLFSF